jgi:hypothetical protein
MGIFHLYGVLLGKAVNPGAIREPVLLGAMMFVAPPFLVIFFMQQFVATAREQYEERQAKQGAEQIMERTFHFQLRRSSSTAA